MSYEKIGTRLKWSTLGIVCMVSYFSALYFTGKLFDVVVSALNNGVADWGVFVQLDICIFASIGAWMIFTKLCSALDQKLAPYFHAHAIFQGDVVFPK